MVHEMSSWQDEYLDVPDLVDKFYALIAKHEAACGGTILINVFPRTHNAPQVHATCLRCGHEAAALISYTVVHNVDD